MRLAVDDENQLEPATIKDLSQNVTMVSEAKHGGGGSSAMAR